MGWESVGWVPVGWVPVGWAASAGRAGTVRRERCTAWPALSGRLTSPTTWPPAFPGRRVAMAVAVAKGPERQSAGLVARTAMAPRNPTELRAPVGTAGTEGRPVVAATGAMPTEAPCTPTMPPFGGSGITYSGNTVGMGAGGQANPNPGSGRIRRRERGGQWQRRRHGRCRVGRFGDQTQPQLSCRRRRPARWAMMSWVRPMVHPRRPHRPRRLR